MNYWLLKTEPEAYSWDRLVADGKGGWDGVRNFMAARNLRAMKVGDRAFFYHTGDEKRIVGVCEVTKEAYPDKSDPTGKFVMVDVKPLQKAPTPVTLAEIKADKQFADFLLVRQGRLSVMPVPPEHWKTICKRAGLDG
jgi:predicted RNA-binding protein with PUA-like domain